MNARSIHSRGLLVLAMAWPHAFAAPPAPQSAATAPPIDAVQQQRAQPPVQRAIAAPPAGRLPAPTAISANWDFGCANDAFPQSQRVARQIRFAMPIPASQIFGVIPEPAVIHKDEDGVQHGSLTQCSTFAPGHLCYDWHEGTDFSLGGAFLQMGTVAAVAGARGIVIGTDDSHFDACHVNPDPLALTDATPANNVICPDPDNPESVAVGAENYVRVCHPDGTITQYLHLMENSIPPQVANGQTVECGASVGLVGSSGKSSAPHLHFDVLLPASRAQVANPREKTIGGRTYVYVDPFAAPGGSLWMQPTSNYGAGLSGTVLLPTVTHPQGDSTTLACAHLVPPHSGHPGPTTACLHPLHANGDPVMTACTHPAHQPHGLVPCTHPAHANGHPLYVGGKQQFVACTHPQHANGHQTTLPCTHPPVPAHPAGHPGPTVPCSHVTLASTSLSAGFNLPGPQCDI